MYIILAKTKFKVTTQPLPSQYDIPSTHWAPSPVCHLSARPPYHRSHVPQVYTAQATEVSTARTRAPSYLERAAAQASPGARGSHHQHSPLPFALRVRRRKPGHQLRWDDQAQDDHADDRCDSWCAEGHCTSPGRSRDHPQNDRSTQHASATWDSLRHSDQE